MGKPFIYDFFLVFFFEIELTSFPSFFSSSYCLPHSCFSCDLIRSKYNCNLIWGRKPNLFHSFVGGINGVDRNFFCDVTSNSWNRIFAWPSQSLSFVCVCLCLYSHLHGKKQFNSVIYPFLIEMVTLNNILMLLLFSSSGACIYVFSLLFGNLFYHFVSFIWLLFADFISRRHQVHIHPRIRAHRTLTQFT